MIGGKWRANTNKMVNKRLLEIAGRWKNSILPKEKKQPKKQRNPKENKLERDSEEKPKITLSELEKTVVHTPTLEEYDTLMQVYECGRWKWVGENLPTGHNNWNVYKEETCIRVKSGFTYGYEGYCRKEGYDVILTQEFYDTQNITQENINEINSYFETLKA